MATDRRRQGAHLEVGVAGLGGGALAAYVEPDMAMTFFEIDPVVVRVASDPRYFTYCPMRRSRPADRPRRRPAVARGRAGRPRSTCSILDAFSSDSPPVHLLTAEAVADEVRTVKPDGLIAFHVSNRYYDLAPAVAAAAARDRG